MTIKFTSVPPKTLYQAILSSASSFKLPNIEGWNGVDLTSADFGTQAFGAFLSADRRLLELFEWDPSTIANASITILYRGLKYDGTQTTEVTANKLDWPAGTTSVMLGSDIPQLMSLCATLGGANTFTALNIFNGYAPQTNTDPVAGNDLTRLSYIQALVLGTLTTIDLIVPGTAGETLVDGNLIYLKTADNRWWKCDADTSTTVDNVLLGIAQGAGTAGNQITNGVMLQGTDNAQSALTGGTIMYASNTAGGISSTPGTTEVTVGIAKSATELYFSPRFNQQITEDQQDAMAGTSGTPSGTNKFVTNDDTAIASAVSKVVRAKSDGKIDSTWFGPTASSFMAGATITAGQPLHITPYAQSDGGITFDAKTGTSYSNATNQSMTHVVGSGNNRFLLVSILTANAPSSVTYAGVTMTLVDSQYDGSAYTLRVYSLVAPTSGSNSVTVTGTGIYAILASSYSNCAQTSTISATNKTTGTVTTLTTTTSTVASGSMVYAAMAGGGLAGTQSGSFTFNTKYKYQQAGINPVTAQTSAPSSFAADTNIFNEVQNISMISTWAGTGGGSPLASQIQVTVAPFATPSIGVVPANSTVVVNNEPLVDFIGFADSSVGVGATVSVSVAGVVTGLSGLTVGRKYYLQNTVGTIGLTAGTYAKAIGYALSTTTLFIDSQKTAQGTGIAKTSTAGYFAETDGFIGTATASVPILRGTAYTGSASITTFYPLA